MQTTTMSDQVGDGGDARVSVNARLRHALEQYLALDYPPGFAVLLDGRWGAGKTHLVREVIDAAARDGRRLLMVSLYGLSSRAEIDVALATSRWPWIVDQPHAAAPMHGDPVRARMPLPLNPPRVSGADADAFVFDDLERCGMSPADALGYINQYVERDGAKVIVIAHREIAKQQCEEGVFDAAVEKVIGRTFSVKPEFREAFAAFVNRIKSAGVQKYLRSVEADLAKIHAQSQTDNLRVLQHSIWDFERLYIALRPEHLAKEGAMAELLRSFFALAFEFKVGNLNSADFNQFTEENGDNWLGAVVSTSNRNEVLHKYPGVQPRSSLLSDEVIYALLAEGLVDADLVRRDFERSSWFGHVAEPSWRVVWYSDQRSESEVLHAADVLMAEFVSRSYTRSGEMLHVFSQLLKLSELDVIKWDRDETIAECRRYIDDLRAAGSLEPPSDDLTDSVRYGSYDGLGFDQRDGEAFGLLFAYLRDQRQLAAEDRYDEQAAKLFALLKSEPTAFVRQIAYNQGATSAPFSRIPVLARLDPQAFADALIALAPLRLSETLFGLANRYDMGAFNREMGPERPWAEALERALTERAAQLSPLSRDRVVRIVRTTLSKSLEDNHRAS